ncbi:hypothetical protein NUU61_002325 [Penicillium alfredii]|uniref:Uncharacterized protein n=1 Tax=Penicillium alfredii TaxID=1506179 RepID=A0A9W9FRD2_9EURO|nr:uncharacterized protein NUU61_002325 [Penicillium alfredii]KAJ5104978.1 hypothetical protein NUU61_002325 [Penicillium alfredii]
MELATVAYVFLAIFAYGFWWRKPKDISTPIAVLLQMDCPSGTSQGGKYTVSALGGTMVPFLVPKSPTP